MNHSQQQQQHSSSLNAVTSQTTLCCRMMMIVLLSSTAAVQGFAPVVGSPSWTTASSTRTFLSPPQQQDNQDHSHSDDPTAFTVGILGDLHMDPRYMDDYEQGRQHWRQIFQQDSRKNQALVSLGDLGESQAIDPEHSSELFSGTTACHTLAADYLSSMGVPYHVVGGNHDLEGLDEFATDQANLEMFLRVHHKKRPYFLEPIAEKTILVGLTSTVFRDAPYTSHEVVIDDYQLKWFETVLRLHPASKGWKVLVMTHAPPLGSGLRHLQENHVANGCCWLNHSSATQVTKFIDLVRQHDCIKAWFSGHFHLGHDYPDSITFPVEEEEIVGEDGTTTTTLIDQNRGSCVFCQTSVLRQETARDGRRQSRLIRGNAQKMEICTVQHDRGGDIRVDATIDYGDDKTTYHRHTTNNNAPCADEEAVYTPRQNDEYYVPPNADGEVHVPFENKDTTRAWWHMADGRVLGIIKGMLVEFEPSTLAPLGLVVGGDELVGKRVAVVNCDAPTAADGGDSTEDPTQALILLEDAGQVTVVQPNEDGSYWRKIVRNKVLRMKERQREQAAKEFAAKWIQEKDDDSDTDDDDHYISGDADYDALLELYNRATSSSVSSAPIDSEEDNQPEITVVSSWGPYKSTSGTAKRTGVPGVTTPPQESTTTPTKSDTSKQPVARIVAKEQTSQPTVAVTSSSRR